MTWYRVADQDIYFSNSVQELESFRHPAPMPAPVLRGFPPVHTLISHTQGWVGGEIRGVEIWSAPPGRLIKINEIGEFYIGHDHILRTYEDEHLWTDLEREAAVGAALVLALSMHDTWCLHASAAMFNGQITVFLGESGQGKSTLAGSLSRAGWILIADDILPVKRGQAGVQILPHFPQLKLMSQPGASLVESLPLSRICVLEQADIPDVQRLPVGDALQALLRHTAGTRLFDPPLLAKHLAFCAWASPQIPVYRLAYPHRWESLPRVQALLENLC